MLDRHDPGTDRIVDRQAVIWIVVHIQYQLTSSIQKRVSIPREMAQLQGFAFSFIASRQSLNSL